MYFIFIGVFTCGPASVKAIKQGKLYLGFDTRFLFAEVNGDRIHWTIDAEGNMEAIAEEKTIVGRFLSTKAVNTISREDVTSSYRYAEGITIAVQHDIIYLMLIKECGLAYLFFVPFNDKLIY